MIPDQAALDALASLSEPLRAELFVFIRRSDRPVTRDEAAAHAGISRNLAAFHLDKLVDAGLLTSRCAMPDGARRVGRAPRVYEPSHTPMAVSVPPRRPEVLVGTLIEALRSGTGAASVSEVARGRGRDFAASRGSARGRSGRLGTERALTSAEDDLAGLGFEPRRTAPTQLRLSNCPFQPAAAEAPDVVCAVTTGFLNGYLEGLGADSSTVVTAEEATGGCCVRLCSRRSLGDSYDPSETRLIAALLRRSEIERAKGLLAETLGVSLVQAALALQEAAARHGRPIEDEARAVLAGETTAGIPAPAR